MRLLNFVSICSYFVVAAGVNGTLAFGEDASTPKLGKVFLPDSVRFVTSTSEDLQSGVLIFDNFVLATATGKGELVNAQTKTFTFTNPTEAKDAASVALEIRGFVSTQEGGSASVMIHVGGETTVVDLSKASAAGASKARTEGDELYAMAAASAESADFEKTVRPKASQDYYAKVTTTLAKGVPLQATVVLLVDRLTAASSQAMIAVDSIDISIKAAPVSKSLAAAGKKVEKPDSDNADKDPQPAKRKATVSKASASKTSAAKNSASKTAVQEGEAKETETADPEKDTEKKPAAKAADKKETKPAAEDAEPVKTSSKKVAEKKPASKKSE